jgi:hypothetical protein
MIRALPIVTIFAFGCATSSEAPFAASEDGQTDRIVNPALADGAQIQPVSIISDSIDALGSAGWEPADVETGKYTMTLESVMYDDTDWGQEAGDSRTIKIQAGDDGMPYLMKKAPMYTDDSRLHASASLQTDLNDTCVFIQNITADGSFTGPDTFQMIIRESTAAQGQNCFNEDGMDMSNPSTMIYVASFERKNKDS